MRRAKLPVMCGRFVLKTSLEQLQGYFGIQRVKYAPEPSFNIAPTQTVAAVVENAAGTRGLVGLKWGLIPPWSADESAAAKMINARSESIHEKPSFREAFHHQRCLILADGFFEWKKGQKTPYFIYDREHKPLAFAGIYSFWKSPKGEQVATCAIVTTAANTAIDAFHHRMPVILPEAAQQAWLRKELTETAPLLSLLQSYPAEDTAFHTVDPAINKVQVNRPENLEPYLPEDSSEGPQQTALFEQLFADDATP